MEEYCCFGILNLKRLDHVYINQNIEKEDRAIKEIKRRGKKQKGKINNKSVKSTTHVLSWKDRYVFNHTIEWIYAVVPPQQLSTLKSRVYIIYNGIQIGPKP